VVDLDVPFLDIDVRGAVFSHGAQLDEVTLGHDFPNREEQIQRPHDVVDLRENRVLAIDHRVRRGALLGEVDDGVRLHPLEDR